jgi:hypothetical protein
MYLSKMPLLIAGAFVGIFLRTICALPEARKLKAVFPNP